MTQWRRDILQSNRRMVADRLDNRDNLYKAGEVKEEDLSSMMGTVRSPAEMDPVKDVYHEVQINCSKFGKILKHLPFKFNTAVK